MDRLKSGAIAGKFRALLLVSILFQSGLPAFAQLDPGIDPTVNPPLPADVEPAPTPAPAAAPSPKASLHFTPPGAAATTSSATPASASTTTGDTTSGDASPLLTAQQPPEVTDPVAIAQATQRAGFPPAQASRNLPVTVGTVQVRRPFKIFVREELVRNLSFRDTPVREVIAELARRGNLNIMIDRSVLGNITGELRDVTLNEAMDSVLAAAGLQSRRLDNNTVVVGTAQAMVQLGLNRTMAKAFKVSYANAFDVASILYASVFNRGLVPDFNKSQLSRQSNTDRTEAGNEATEQSGASGSPGASRNRTVGTSTSELVATDDTRQISRPDTARTVRGASRSQTTEGIGYNNASTDPGSQQIRAYQETATDYTVEQNGGGAIVIPDTKNRQVLVIGTSDDLNLAEEAIRLLDRRPRQLHIQASLIELTNDAIRQLGANIQLQGEGASSSLLGNATAPLVQFLPGLGSPGPLVTNGTTNTANLATSFPPPANTFSGTSTFNNSFQTQQPISTTVAGPGTAFTGLIGTLLPTIASSIAGVASTPQAASGFNFVTLGRRAGGRANIATLPTAMNISLSLLLQTDKAKLIANPSVVVVDNTESLITIATEVIHKVTATVSLGVVSTNVELTKAGIFLNVLPKVAEDGFVTMRLRPQVSAPVLERQFGTTIVTLLSIREIMSQEVRIKDGQTLVLGGLFQENEAARISKVPYLAETPVLGALFRNTLKGRNRTELMLLITPKIVEEEPPSVSESSPSRTL
jgi:type II secretory pathway component GspD/PulD (secretin)